MNDSSLHTRKLGSMMLGAMMLSAFALTACDKDQPPPPPPPPAEPLPPPAPRMEMIKISDRIQFETGNAVLLPASYPVLNQVVKVMNDNPHIQVVQIEGHTDTVGDEKENLLLSQQRAESVRTYLITQGIDGNRLTARGFGQRVPVVSNDSEVGRLQNRRVEFRIIEQGQ